MLIFDIGQRQDDRHDPRIELLAFHLSNCEHWSRVRPRSRRRTNACRSACDRRTTPLSSGGSHDSGVSGSQARSTQSIISGSTAILIASSRTADINPQGHGMAVQIASTTECSARVQPQLARTAATNISWRDSLTLLLVSRVLVASPWWLLRNFIERHRPFDKARRSRQLRL